MPLFLKQEGEARAGRTKPQRQDRLTTRGEVCKPVLSLRLRSSCLRKRGCASFPGAGMVKTQRQERLTGSTGLYMNYSIISYKVVKK